MSKKMHFIFSVIFLIAGSIIYTFERGISYLIWVGKMNAASHTGSYPSLPELQPIFSNIFFPLFILLSIIFFVSGFKKAN